MSWDSIITAHPAEHDTMLPVFGNLPEQLLGGSYYLNGPGMLGEHGVRLHPFDGHGLLRKLVFTKEGVQFKNRFIQTESYKKEKKSGKVCYRGIGGLPYNNHFKNWWAGATKNPANTCILPWQGKILCSYEGGWPHLVDPESLETYGLENFSNTLVKGLNFLAHTRYDARKKELFGVSFKPGKNSTFYIHGYAEDGSSILQQEHTQFGMTIIHDFMITDHFVIIMENPVIPEIPVLVKSLFGIEPVMKALKQQDRPARLMLFPRTGGSPRVIEMDASYLAFHHGSAREVVNEKGEPESIEFFSCIFDRYIDFGREFGYQGNDKPYADQFSSDQPPQLLRKVSVNLETEQCNVETVTDWAIDFPMIHPDGDGRGATHIYGAAASPKGTFNPFDTFCRIDLNTGESEHWKSDCGYLGEGYFIPNGATEESGFIVVMAYRPDGTELLVLQAENLSAGPIARASLPETFPYGFHGYFHPANQM